MVDGHPTSSCPMRSPGEEPALSRVDFCPAEPAHESSKSRPHPQNQCNFIGGTCTTSALSLVQYPHAINFIHDWLISWPQNPQSASHSHQSTKPADPAPLTEISVYFTCFFLESLITISLITTGNLSIPLTRTLLI